MSFWDWVPTVIDVGASIWGANEASEAQERSAQIAAQSQRRTNDLTRQSTEAGLEAVRVAQDDLRRQQAQAAGGVQHIQRVINRGEELTPVQVRGLEDARRHTLNTLQGGSLRGSARATSATIADVEGRLRDRYIQQNRDRSDQAASNISGQYFNAGKNVADLTLKSGDVEMRGLTQLSNGEANTGQNRINTNQNLASIRGDAIGDIGAVIADQLKNERKSNYERVK